MTHAEVFGRLICAHAPPYLALERPLCEVGPNLPSGVWARGASHTAPEPEEIHRIGFLYEGYCFVLDAEAMTDEYQELRFGAHSVYGLPGATGRVSP